MCNASTASLLSIRCPRCKNASQRAYRTSAQPPGAYLGDVCSLMCISNALISIIIIIIMIIVMILMILITTIVSIIISIRTSAQPPGAYLGDVRS